MSEDAPEARSCYSCRFLLRETESWEMPHIRWYECRERPAMENLKTFPFRRTKCQTWEPKKLVWALLPKEGEDEHR